MRFLTVILTFVCASHQSYSGDLFRNVLPSESGISWVHENRHSARRCLQEIDGPGVAIFDYNNDGWMDILFINSGDASFYHPKVLLKHALYCTNGDGIFTDITRQADITANIYGMGIAEKEHPLAKSQPSQMSLLLSRTTARLVRTSMEEPTSAQALWEQAKAAIERQDFSDARQLLERAVKLDPRDASLWFHLGATCSALGDTDAAIADFERARALAPREPQIYFNLGLLYWRQGNVGSAKQAYRAGLALSPNDSAALRNFSVLLMKTRQFEDAIPLLLRLKGDRDLILPVYVSLIECYLETGQPAKAEAESDELLKSGLTTPADQTKLAGILITYGSLRAAERVLQNSLALDPNQANANAILGGIYFEQKDYPHAVGSLQQAVQLAPDSSEYALALARVLLAANQQQALLPFLKSVAPKFGKLPEFQYTLAFTYFGATQFKDAVSILQTLVHSDAPRQDRAYFLLGNCYLKLGQINDAEQAYRKAVEINPKNARYYEELASVLRLGGPAKLDDAIAQLEEAGRLDPNNANIEVQLGLSYEAKGKFPEAAASLEKAVADRPDLAPAHVALARIYFHLGRKQDAARESTLVNELARKAQQSRNASHSNAPSTAP